MRLKSVLGYQLCQTCPDQGHGPKSTTPRNAFCNIMHCRDCGTTSRQLLDLRTVRNAIPTVFIALSRHSSMMAKGRCANVLWCMNNSPEIWPLAKPEFRSKNQHAKTFELLPLYSTLFMLFASGISVSSLTLHCSCSRANAEIKNENGDHSGPKCPRHAFLKSEELNAKKIDYKSRRWLDEGLVRVSQYNKLSLYLSSLPPPP